MQTPRKRTRPFNYAGYIEIMVRGMELPGRQAFYVSLWPIIPRQRSFDR